MYTHLPQSELSRELSVDFSSQGGTNLYAFMLIYLTSSFFNLVIGNQIYYKNSQLTLLIENVV